MGIDDIHSVFESFDEEPIASGTVAQVHRARLRPEHGIVTRAGLVVDVAVKVRHPTVMEESFADMDIICTVVQAIPFLHIDVPFNRKGFIAGMQSQFDFRGEAYVKCDSLLQPLVMNTLTLTVLCVVPYYGLWLLISFLCLLFISYMPS